MTHSQNDEYTFVYFGVDTLFANVPLKKTTKTIWNRVFSKFQKQLIKDCIKSYYLIPLPKLLFILIRNCMAGS